MKTLYKKSKIKVDLIYSGWLSAPNGVSTFLNTFKEGIPFLNEHDVNLSIISSDIFYKRDFEQSSKTLKGFLKIFLKKLIPFSKTLTVYYLKMVEKNYLKIVNHYLKKENKADVLFFQELLTCYHYLKISKNKKIKIVLVLHTNGDTFNMVRTYYPKLKATNYYKYLLEVEKEVINKVDKLGFVSKNSMNHFIALNPDFNKEKLFYVLNGVGNSPKIRENNSLASFHVKYSFCCIGSITKRKGQELIVRAFNKLSLNEKVQFNITFLGEGEEKEKLVNYVKKHKLENYIYFKGSVNNVDSYLSISNGFILTSYDEGLPISIIEALRYGLPIIATNVGGIPEMLDDKYNGFLIEPREEELLNLFKNLGDYDLEEFGRNSLKMYQNKFTQDAMFTNYTNVFLNL